MSDPHPVPLDGSPDPLAVAGEEGWQETLRFPEGLLGFESCRHFTLLSSHALTPLQLLHANDGPAASFLVVDPRLVLPAYRCVLKPRDRARMGFPADNALI